MMRSLIAAKEFDEAAQLLILEFTLSGEINRDDHLERVARRNREPDRGARVADRPL